MFHGERGSRTDHTHGGEKKRLLPSRDPGYTKLMLRNSDVEKPRFPRKERKFSHMGYQTQIGPHGENYGKTIVLADARAIRDENIDQVFIRLDTGKLVRMDLIVDSGEQVTHTWVNGEQRTMKQPQFHYRWELQMDTGMRYALNGLENVRLGYPYALGMHNGKTQPLGAIEEVTLVNSTKHSLPDGVQAREWVPVPGNPSELRVLPESSMASDFQSQIEKAGIYRGLRVEAALQREKSTAAQWEQPLERAYAVAMKMHPPKNLFGKIMNSIRVEDIKAILTISKPGVRAALHDEQAFDHVAQVFERTLAATRTQMPEIRPFILQCITEYAPAIRQQAAEVQDVQKRARAIGLLEQASVLATPQQQRMLTDALVSIAPLVTEDIQRRIIALDNTSLLRTSKELDELSAALVSQMGVARIIAENIDEMSSQQLESTASIDALSVQNEQVGEILRDSYDTLLQRSSQMSETIRTERSKLLVATITNAITEFSEGLDMQATLAKIPSGDRSADQQLLTLLFTFYTTRRQLAQGELATMDRYTLEDIQEDLGSLRSACVFLPEAGKQYVRSHPPREQRSQEIRQKLVEKIDQLLPQIEHANRLNRQYKGARFRPDYLIGIPTQAMRDALAADASTADFDPTFLRFLTTYIDTTIQDAKEKGIFFQDRETAFRYFEGQSFTPETTKDMVQIEGFGKKQKKRNVITEAGIRKDMLADMSPAFLIDLSIIRVHMLPPPKVAKQHQDDEDRILHGQYSAQTIMRENGDLTVEPAAIDMFIPISVKAYKDAKTVQERKKTYKKTLTHEVAHHMHMEILTVDELADWDTIIQTDTTPVSPYVVVARELQTDRQNNYYAGREDFSDSFSLFREDPVTLYILSEKRFAFMRDMQIRRTPLYQREQVRAYYEQIIQTGEESLTAKNVTREQKKSQLLNDMYANMDRIRAEYLQRRRNRLSTVETELIASDW